MSKMNSLTLLLVMCHYFQTNSASSHVPPTNSKLVYDNSLDFKVESGSGKQYNLRLRKASETILHPDIKVINVKEDDNTGKLLFDAWSPSKEELKEAHNVFIDEKNHAAVRFHHENGANLVSGVVDGMMLEGKNGAMKKLVNVARSNRSDYINYHRKLTATRSSQQSPVDAVIEVVVVCDKDFGDIFQQRRQSILSYFTAYFWDINSRFKTLPSSSISFRITGIVIIESESGQPFIEGSRNSEGKTAFDRILERFSFWIYRQGSRIPNFDLAIVITNTDVEHSWEGGLAYQSGVCGIDHSSRRHMGTLVFNDNGGWGSVRIASHLIAHSLGALHDDDPNIPGGCSDRDYLMSGMSWDLMWYFSPCSDRLIRDFLLTYQADCTRRINEIREPAIDPENDYQPPASMDLQCQRRLRQPTAVSNQEDEDRCKVMRCWLWVQEQNQWLLWSFAPVENSPCGRDMNCFRGKCRKRGAWIMNLFSGLCLKDTNSFTHSSRVELATCKGYGSMTPLDRFEIIEGNHGQMLSTPWNSPDAREVGEKCVWTGNRDGDLLWTDRCDLDNRWLAWELVDTSDLGQLLRHRITRRCVLVVGSTVVTTRHCDPNDSKMIWIPFDD